MKSILISVFAACLLPAMAAEKLSPGMPAPPLVSGEYIQGEPVKEFEKGKVYIVEFWATWCGPCVATIPHVNELQQKFADKGLVVIGQNVWERQDDKVKPFVGKMGDKMTYRVAMDDKSDGGKGRMAETWMQAAGQNGIPAAFVVDKKGTIAWIGHPARLNEELLGEIIAGTFDTAAHAEQMKKQDEARGKVRGLFDNYKKALNENNMEAATRAVDELQALNDPRLQSTVSMCRLDIAVKSADGKAAGVQALAILTVAGKMSNKSQAAFLLNQSALKLCNADGVKDLDPKVAVQLAEEASALSGGANGDILSTLARAKFVAGDKEGAISSQQSAIQHAANEKLKAKMEEALASYKEGKLPAADSK
jgi:thiol-disulfide isomerase/thioredoxin